MLTTYFRSASTVAHYLAGSAGPYLDRFVSWLAIHGYQRVSIRRHVREVVHFSVWANSVGVATPPGHTTLAKLRDHLGERDRLRYPSGNQHHLYQSARVYVRFLSDIGAICSAIEPVVADVPALFVEFRDWMKSHRGTRDSTLAGYLPPVTNLLRTLGLPSTYSAQCLRTFFLQQVRQNQPEKSKNFATATRMFLRFLIARGDCAPGLDFAIPTVARWRLSRLPKYLPSEAVEALIASCDPSTSLGARDRAILLLIARLGLRAGEVSGLEFRQVHWSRATLRVMGKSRREVELPLPQEVGDAILHYLQNGRPRLYSLRRRRPSSQSPGKSLGGRWLAPSVVLASTRRVGAPTFSAIQWQPACCVRVYHCPPSALCFATVRLRLQRFTRRWMSTC